MGSAASTVTDNFTHSVILVCHSSDEKCLRELASRGNRFPADDVMIITECYPEDVQTRADILNACHGAVIGLGPAFQTAPVLISTLSFLKDNKKSIQAGPLTFFTRPSGATGAVCTAYGQWKTDLFESVDSLQTNVTLMLHSTNREILERGQTADQVAEIEASDQHICADAGNNTTSKRADLFFAYADEVGREIAEFFQKLESPSVRLDGTSATCTQHVESDLTTLASCGLAAFVITPDCHLNEGYRRLFEASIRWRKPILPINAQAPLTGWLKVAMAGRLWYQVVPSNLKEVYTPYSQIPDSPCKVSDSCLAIDFLVCANGLLADAGATGGYVEASAISTRELALIQAAKDKALVHGIDSAMIESACEQVREAVGAHRENVEALTTLGVASRAHEVDLIRTQNILPFPSAEKLIPEGSDLEMANIHYSVTRLSFSPPPSVLDANGLPLLNLQLDAMFSYQWGSQSTVLDVYQQGRVANLRAWFDVYGYMQGNVNSAMAAAVESVACVVVFVTDKYTQSVNCQLEFLYAAHLHKPFILVFLTNWRAMALPSWMTDAVGTDFDIYPSRVDSAKATPDRVLALDFTAERINGHPATTVLFSAIRVLAAERNNAPSPIAYDGSLLLYATTSALHHAMSSSNAVNDTQTSSSLVCTRCNTLFLPSVASSLDGCHVHSAYYMGGTLLAGRWVCCQETRTDGPGCQPATHTAITRTWTCDPAYGTYSWQPA